MTDDQTFVIIGASLAGAKAAETLREEGFTGRVILVGEEPDHPYERPPLSKGYLLGQEPREKAYVHDEPWYAANRIDLRLGVRATGLALGTRTVTLNGGESLRYDKLLLATGSRVRRLDLPGVNLTGVHYLRTIGQSDELLALLREGTRVVVVGAGWIGLETAAAARNHGSTVSVIEMDTLPLRRILGDEVAAVFDAVHRAHGVDFHYSSGVKEFIGLDGQLTHVVTSDGSRLPADLAILGVGIMPNVELAAAAGLTVDNGVVTDASLRTSDPHVWACGDVANSLRPLVGERIRVEHWANALQGGPAAAKSMLGQNVTYDPVPYFFTDQYLSEPSIGMEYAGYVGRDGYDEVVFRGSPAVRSGANPEFIAFWVKGGRVLAGMNVNVWDVTDAIQELVRAGYAGRSVDLARLADPAVEFNQL